MTSPQQRPVSVREIGQRRLGDLTIGLVVVGVGAVIGLVVYDAGHHNSDSASTGTSTSTSTPTGGDSVTQDPSSSGFGGSTLTPSQNAPQATSGGS